MGVFNNTWKSHNPFTPDRPPRRRDTQGSMRALDSSSPGEASSRNGRVRDGEYFDAPGAADPQAIKYPSHYVCMRMGQWDLCDINPDDASCEALWPRDEANECAAAGGAPTCFFRQNRRTGKDELQARECIINPLIIIEVPHGPEDE